jgi:uncharacterized membrane protein YedE/YeeE
MSSVAEKLAKKSDRPNSAKQVRLKLVYIDFWSAVKLSFLIAVCMAVITLVATFLVWTVLNQTDVFGQVNELTTDIAGGTTEILTFVQLANVMGFAAIVALLNLIVITALGAVFALLYNTSVKITGGLLVGFTNN